LLFRDKNMAKMIMIYFFMLLKFMLANIQINFYKSYKIVSLEY
jgi:hypothetical protein